MYSLEMRAKRHIKSHMMPKEANINPRVLLMLPALESGGVERCVLEIAKFLKKRAVFCVVCSKGGGLVKELEQADIVHERLDLKTHKPWVIRKNREILKYIIAKYEINLIHSHSRVPNLQIWPISRQLGIRLISTVHSAYPYRTWLKKKYNAIMTKGNPIIVVSEFIRQYMRAHYHVPDERMKVIYPGVDHRLYDPDRVSKEAKTALLERWAHPTHKKVLIFPARVTRHKGHLVFLQALHEMREEKSLMDWQCYIVGGTNKQTSGYEKELKKTIEKYKLSDLVKMVGLERDMVLVYAVANLSVTASLQGEAFGLVNAEALAMEVPVLATSHGASLEIIDEGKNGWLVPPADVKALVHKLKMILPLSKESLKSYGKKGRNKICQNYPLEKMVKETLSLYQKVIIN